MLLFEGVSLATVILAPGACRRVLIAWVFVVCVFLVTGGLILCAGVVLESQSVGKVPRGLNGVAAGATDAPLPPIFVIF